MAFAVSTAPAAEPYDAKAAFERLKSLAGEWQAKTKEGNVKVTYEVISGGSALLEREVLPSGGDMVSVYHLDGPRLMMTHYCLAQNQPRLMAKSYDPAKGELVFEFLDVTNLSRPGAGHINGAVFRFVDRDNIKSEWSFVQDGKQQEHEVFEVKRVR